MIAVMKADSATERRPIDYQGPVGRLKWKPETGDAMDFKVMFRSLAREHQAQMELLEQDEATLPPITEEELELAEAERLMLKKSRRGKSEA